MVAWSFAGITTLLPHMRQPPSNPSSVCRDLNGWSSLGASDGHPDWTNITTLLKTRSRRVSRWMSVAVTGRVSILRIGRLCISEGESRGSVSGRGSRDSPSALA